MFGFIDKKLTRENLTFLQWLNIKIDQILVLIGVYESHSHFHGIDESYKPSAVLPLRYWCTACEKVENVTRHMTCEACGTSQVYPISNPKDPEHNIAKRLNDIKEANKLKI